MSDAGLTATRLAGLAELSQSTVSRAVAGETIHTGSAMAIAAALGRQIEEVFPLGNYATNGHPPQVSHSYGARSSAAVVPCPHCFMALPVTGICDDCG